MRQRAPLRPMQATPPWSLPFTSMQPFSKPRKIFFKYKAIFGVATALSDLDYTVTSGKQVKDIKGIGKSSQLKIDEFVSTGKIGAIDDLKGESGVAAAPISKDAEIALKFV